MFMIRSNKSKNINYYDNLSKMLPKCDIVLLCISYTENYKFMDKKI